MTLGVRVKRAVLEISATNAVETIRASCSLTVISYGTSWNVDSSVGAGKAITSAVGSGAIGWDQWYVNGGFNTPRISGNGTIKIYSRWYGASRYPEIRLRRASDWGIIASVDLEKEFFVPENSEGGGGYYMTVNLAQTEFYCWYTATWNFSTPQSFYIDSLQWQNDPHSVTSYIEISHPSLAVGLRGQFYGFEPAGVYGSDPLTPKYGGLPSPG